MAVYDKSIWVEPIFEQTEDAWFYRVMKAKNTVKPLVGSQLTEAEVQDFIKHGMEVTITLPKAKK